MAIAIYPVAASSMTVTSALEKLSLNIAIFFTYRNK